MEHSLLGFSVSPAVPDVVNVKYDQIHTIHELGSSVSPAVPDDVNGKGDQQYLLYNNMRSLGLLSTLWPMDFMSLVSHAVPQASLRYLEVGIYLYIFFF